MALEGSTPSLWRRAIQLALLGATLGPLLDLAHARTGAIAYDTAVTALGVPWWVTLVYTGAALGIGLTHPALDRWMKRPQRVALSNGNLVIGFVGMAVLWVASGLLPGSSWAVTAVLLAGATGLFVALDRTWQGAVMALATGAGGVIVETTLVHLGLFHHRSPDVIGLPIWLPCLYFGGSVAIGNLGRRASRGWRLAPGVLAPGRDRSP